MATRKEQELQRKRTPQVLKKEVASISFDDPLPGQLEREFRRALGRHNLHVNMLELAAQTFANTLPEQREEASYIRDCAKKLGFHSLYPDASFSSARNYLVYSHIAYVFSAGDMLCERIRSMESMKSLKNDNPALFTEINTGDFVKKTLALTVLATLVPEQRTADVVLLEVEKIQKLPCFALVNYYRIVRNEELHATGESDRKTAAVRSALPEQQIEAQYKMKPLIAGHLSSQDALLCSKAWQNVSKWLCRHMLNDTASQSVLRKRFGRLESHRRAVAAMKFMELELLYTPLEINGALEALQW